MRRMLFRKVLGFFLNYYFLLKIEKTFVVGWQHHRFLKFIIDHISVQWPAEEPHVPVNSAMRKCTTSYLCIFSSLNSPQISINAWEAKHHPFLYFPRAGYTTSYCILFCPSLCVCVCPSLLQRPSFTHTFSQRGGVWLEPHCCSPLLFLRSRTHHFSSSHKQQPSNKGTDHMTASWIRFSVCITCTVAACSLGSSI